MMLGAFLWTYITGIVTSLLTSQQGEFEEHIKKKTSMLGEFCKLYKISSNVTKRIKLYYEHEEKYRHWKVIDIVKELPDC
jgi:hypothetical protein